jgi:hypothetical protein
MINWLIKQVEMKRTQTLGISLTNYAIAHANKSLKNFSKMTVAGTYSDVSGKKCTMKSTSLVQRERTRENQGRQNRQKMGLHLNKRTWKSSETIRMHSYSIEITVHSSKNCLLYPNTSSTKMTNRGLAKENRLPQRNLSQLGKPLEEEGNDLFICTFTPAFI